MTNPVPYGYLSLEGSGARLFRDKFANQIVARESRGGMERARILRDAESFFIQIEKEGNTLKYTVKTGAYKEIGLPKVAIGPNLAVSMLTDFVPLMRMGVSSPRAEVQMTLSTP